MDNFNKNLINAVKMFSPNDGEDMEDEKISFLKYCFKNIECRDPEDLEICNETFPQLNASVDGYYYDEDTDSCMLFQTIYSDGNDDSSIIDELDYDYFLSTLRYRLALEIEKPISK